MFNNKIQKQLDELKREIDLLKNLDFRLEIQILKTNMNSLRGLINRRIGKTLDIEEKETSKSPDGLDNLRF